MIASETKKNYHLDIFRSQSYYRKEYPELMMPFVKKTNVWQFMEMIHSRSYTYIIKNVYSDPSEIFDTIIHDERILERSFFYHSSV